MKTREYGELVLGREREVQLLVSAIDDAAESMGRIVVLAGEPGIGKTALLWELATIASARHVPSAIARCSRRRDETPPYWPWIQILRRLDRLKLLGAEHRGILDVLLTEPVGDVVPAAGGARSRFEIADSIAHALASAAGEGSLLVGIDDLHAADSSSLRVLEFVASVIDDLPLSVVVTTRAAEPGSDLEALLADVVRQRSARELVVRGLAPATVAVLLESVLGGRADLTSQVWRLTAGNPLYVGEIVRLLEGSDPDQIDRVPVRLTGALRERIAGLTLPARRVLEAIAVLGTESSTVLLASVVGDDIDAALVELDDAAIVERVDLERNPGVRLRHPLFGEAVYAELPPEGRCRWHAAAAGALRNMQPGDVDEIAVHLCGAATADNAASAVAAARSAADRAVRMQAYETAAAHLERAGDAVALIADAAPSEPISIQIAAADAHRRAGSFDRALVRGAAAFNAAELVGLRLLQADAAVAYEEVVWESGAARTGGGDRSIVQLERVLAFVEALPVAIVARAEAALARAYFFVGDARAADLAEKAVADARRSGDPASVAYGLECRRTVVWATAPRDSRAALCADIGRHAAEAGSVDLLLQSRHFALYIALEDGNMAEVDRLIAEFGGLAEEAHSPHGRGYAALFRSMRAIQHADLVMARRQLAAATTIGTGIRSSNIAQFTTAQRFSLSCLDGDWGDLLERFGAFVGPTGSGPTWRCMAIQLAAESGDLDLARGELDAVAYAGYRAVGDDAHRVFSLCCLAEAAVATHANERAGELLTMLHPDRGMIVPNITALHGSVAHACAGLALTVGSTATARSHAEEALARSTGAGATAWVLQAKARLAYAWRANDATDRRADRLLDEVLTAAQARGLSRLAGRAADALERPRPAEHPLRLLTARELDVAALLAEGRTNAEISTELFVSIKTVKSHVSHVLTKLGLTSRTQVALLVQRAGPQAAERGYPSSDQSKDR